MLLAKNTACMDPDTTRKSTFPLQIPIANINIDMIAAEKEHADSNTMCMCHRSKPTSRQMNISALPQILNTQNLN
jgi:hypothetical protein